MGSQKLIRTTIWISYCSIPITFVTEGLPGWVFNWKTTLPSEYPESNSIEGDATIWNFLAVNRAILESETTSTKGTKDWDSRLAKQPHLHRTCKESIQ